MTESTFETLRAYSRTLEAEAAYYWDRHERRYRRMVELLDTRDISGSVLDVGMGFETLLLRKLYPAARVDCIGVEQDGRFLPGGLHEFHRVDLNLLEGGPERRYELVVFMEVLEHLVVPPDLVLLYLKRFLAPGGLLLLSTPNAVWLKNRLKMLRGRNPYELLRPNPMDRGHIREYTVEELRTYVQKAGLELRHQECCGLYRFDNTKDNFYSWLADSLPGTLGRSLMVLCENPKA